MPTAEKIKSLNMSRKQAETWSESGLRYCPELEAHTLIKDDSKELMKLIDLVSNYQRELKFLEPFVGQISQQMKQMGTYSKKSILMIAYSRRLILSKFLVILVFKSLELEKEKQEERPTKAEIINTVFSNLTSSKEFNGPKFKDDDENDEDIEILKTKAENSTVINPLKKDERDSKEENLKGDSKEENSKGDSKEGNSNEGNSKERQKLKSCNHCGKTEKTTNEKPFAVCSACKKYDVLVPYCSTTCQSQDWKLKHKNECAKTNSDRFKQRYSDVD